MNQHTELLSKILSIKITAHEVATLQAIVEMQRKPQAPVSKNTIDNALNERGFTYYQSGMAQMKLAIRGFIVLHEDDQPCHHYSLTDTGIIWLIHHEEDIMQNSKE
jgi:hypothetical protein